MSARKLVLQGIFIVLLYCPVALFAWNALGHQVIANIAYHQLTPLAKSKVDKLITSFHTEHPEINSLADLALWPQSPEAVAFANWHYIRTPVALHGANMDKSRQDENNAVWALDKIKIVLQNPRANIFERVRFLALFTHIVADIHQPLHAMNVYSTMHPNGDKSGELYSIIANNQATNLHAYWDTAAGLLDNNKDSGQIDNFSKRLMALYPSTYFQQRANNLNHSTWVSEEENMSRVIYTLPEKQAPSAAYVKAAQKMSEEQIVLAGYRLGRLINKVLN